MAKTQNAGTSAQPGSDPATLNTEIQVPTDAGQKKPFPPLDPTTFAPQLFWLALSFGVLYIILSRVALPRVSEVIEERRDRIQRDLDAAERLKDETDKAINGYEAALADARSNASGIAKQEREALTTESEREQAKVEDQISAKLAEAETRIAETKQNALTKVTEIASETASAIVGKLIGQNVSPDEAKKALPNHAAK